MILFSKYKYRSMYPINPYSQIPGIVLDSLNVQYDGNNYVAGSASWPSSNGANAATVQGSPAYITSNMGYLQYDAFNDAVFLGSGSVLDYTSGDFTISTWVNVESFTTSSVGQLPILFFKGSFNVRGYYCTLSSNGSINFRTNQSGKGQGTSTIAGTIQLNNWYDITITRQGSSVRIYVNGVDVTSTAGTHVNPTTSTDNFSIGYYPGIYAKLRIGHFLNYNKKLSISEVKQNFQSLRNRYI